MHPDKGEDPQSVTLREAGSADLGRIITRHAEIYGREHGFGDDFARYVLTGLAEYADRDRERSRVWIAEAGGEFAGCVGVVEQADNRAQLRWLLVEPHSRGLGAGRRLVGTAVDFCRDKGFDELFLWTIDFLHPARTLYKSFGFTFSESKPGEMGGVPVTEEMWRLKFKDKLENR
jgi:GNAT superfamily N-acetyltransferase